MPIIDSMGVTHRPLGKLSSGGVTPTNREEGVGLSSPTPSQEGQLVRNKPLYLLCRMVKERLMEAGGSDFDQHLCFGGLGVVSQHGYCPCKGFSLTPETADLLSVPKMGLREDGTMRLSVANRRLHGASPPIGPQGSLKKRGPNSAKKHPFSERFLGPPSGKRFQQLAGRATRSHDYGSTNNQSRGSSLTDC